MCALCAVEGTTRPCQMPTGKLEQKYKMVSDVSLGDTYLYPEQRNKSDSVALCVPGPVIGKTRAYDRGRYIVTHAENMS